MKQSNFTKLSTLLLAIVLTISANQLTAQTTNGIFFQAVARDNFSNPAKDRKIYVQTSIIQTTVTGTKVLTEEHQANTDATGVFSVSIGNGTRVGGTAANLAGIDWSKGPFFLNLKVSITPIGSSASWDYTKEWVDMGTTSFGAVPFSFFAANVAGFDTKVNVADSAKMLLPYAKTTAVTTLSTSVDTKLLTKLNVADSTKYVTPTQLAAKTFDQTPITNAIATKLNIADSTKYVTPTQLAAKTFDQTPITNAIATKLNIADSTNSYVTPTQLAAKTFDQTPITNAIATKLNISDSTNGYVTPTMLAAKTFDTTSLSNRINLKATISDVTSSLATKASNSSLTSGLALKLDANQKGIPNGVASLNALGIIPSNQLPPVTLSSTNVVGSDADMIALSNATVGSIAIRTDLNKNYVLSATPASTLSNWVELLTPAAPVQTVNGYTGSVNITKSDIGLSDVDNTSDISKPISNATQTALDSKANVSDVNAALATKISSADATTALSLKANATDVSSSLATKISTADATAALNLKLDANKVGAVNGVASLNALGKVPTDQIPAISFSSVKVLASQAEMLGLSSAVVGSVVIRTDVNKNYVLAVANPAVLANWIELLTPAPPVQTVNGHTGNVSITKTDLGLENVQNTSDADKTISTQTQSALDAKVDKVIGKALSTNDYTTVEKTKLAAITGTNTGDQDLSPYATNANLAYKANTASPTFTGTVTTSAINTGALSSTSITAPTYASTPKTLTYTGNTIIWNPAQGLNTAITLTQNSALSFTSAPPVGSYGTVVLTQDATGGRTISLPSFSGITNKVLGSTSTTTVSLSAAANAKDILNFYYDGIICYWNIGQGYGAAATSGATNLATGVNGTLLVANGGTGATTLTGLIKGNGTSAMTSAVAGTDYQAPITLTTTGTGAATLSGTTLNIPAVSSFTLPTASGSTLGGVKVGTNLSIDGSGVLSANIIAGSISGTVAIANGGTGATTASAALINLGAAPLASPTFTGTVTTSSINTGALSATSVNTPIYASTPQTLTDAATISWVPSQGLNASVTLAGNRTLSFSTAPASGAYGTLVVKQDATGGRTLTLPSVANKILGSSSTTTIGLSTTANAIDIINFYFDGTNYFWNVGQGYGSASTSSSTANLATGVTGTLSVANGGTGATTLTGYIKGSGTATMTASTTIPVTDLTGTLPIANGGTGSATQNFVDLTTNQTIGGVKTFNGTVVLPTTTTGVTQTAGNNTTAIATTAFVSSAVKVTTGLFSEEVNVTTQTGATASFTLTNTPLNGKVFMYVNGTRIKNGAYSVSGVTVTYTAANNNSYALVAGDRVQFDYAY